MVAAETTTASLEERIRLLEDVKDIERLMARYGECVDNDYDLEGMKEILAEDLVWTSNAFGEYEGLPAYLAGQAEISKGVEWAFHAMVPVRVEVTGGSSARGTFYLLMLATFISSGGDRVPIILSARYDNEFIRANGSWACNRMNVEFHQVSTLTEGWVVERFWQS
jgi:hypothetical protein